METDQRQGLAAVLLGVGLLAGCAGPATQPVAVSEVGAAPAIVSEAPPLPDLEPLPEPEPVAAPLPAGPFITCATAAKQGGAILCRTNPGATVTLDSKPIAIAGEDGVALIGLRRDAPAEVRVAARVADADHEPFATVAVEARNDGVSKFEMDCNRISAQTPAEKRHAEVSWVRKDKAMKQFARPLAPVSLIKPSEGPYSSPYGAVRTYVPKTKDCEGSTSVHNGQDIAIATGTEIRAPMAGTILLADPDLYYEGGAVFLDLGRGLVSVTMHMSRIDVKDGDTVEQGQLLGLSGATGRVTGPHLHWALKFRNVHSDDRGTDIWLDPLALLDLKMPE
jgi:murein DD-endopeptidase MepM/ murein hydrolase activator NlpD